MIRGMMEKTGNPRTITDELLIDIYANPILKTLTIMIDRPFERTLTGLELERASSRLFFVFEEEKRDLGDPLREGLIPFFLDRETVDICQMDVKTKKAVAVFSVPLTVR